MKLITRPNNLCLDECQKIKKSSSDNKNSSNQSTFFQRLFSQCKYLNNNQQKQATKNTQTCKQSDKSNLNNKNLGYQFFDSNKQHFQLKQAAFEQLIELECQNYLIKVNPSTFNLLYEQDHRQNKEFIIGAIEKYAYEMCYSYEIGCILSHVSFNWKNWEAELILKELIRQYSHVFISKVYKQSSQKESKKHHLIVYGLSCVSMYVGSVYKQLQDKTNLFNINNRWFKLVQRMFQSLMFQFIPANLARCLVSIYLNPDNKMEFLGDQNTKVDPYSLIKPFGQFFKLLISLFHYTCFMKSPVNIDHLYEICSNCFMGIVQWPIIISNSHQFDLPIPEFQFSQKIGPK